MLRLVSLFGILALLGLCLLFSRDRRRVPWRLVATGLSMQLALGLLFLYWPQGNAALQRFGRGVSHFLDLAQAGTGFVFNALADPQRVGAVFGPDNGFIFAFMVLPTLIFFCSFMSVLYHLGVMQRIVRAMAWVTVRALGTSGAESLSACANVFVGQTEAPLLVRPFLPGMTKSELHTVMVGGFATIAGGVFALYVGFVGGNDEARRALVAGHLMVASVMAVPAGLVCSKILWPETEVPKTLGRVVGVEIERNANVVEAAAAGASDGLKLALNVAAMLIAFLGLVAVLDWLLAFVPLREAGGERPLLSVRYLLGWVFWPIAAVMGVAWQDVQSLGQLLGAKLAVTELVAYGDLGKMIEAGSIRPRTAMIASFALCGFANFGSVAIQIGGLGAMAPGRRSDLSRLGLRAMFGGAIATCMTACFAGVLSAEEA
ncbi:MAG: nucleoside transporter [Planctomycetota bacterium]